MSVAFGITAEDVENVLRRNWARVANTGGKSFECMAEELLLDLDNGKIEKAALHGDCIDTQTAYALDEIERQLTEHGILEET